MSIPEVEVYFDCSSPWTYLGFVGIQRIAEKYKVDLIWKPIVVGGVFNQVNKDVYARREEGMKDPVAMARVWRDMTYWAEYYGLVIKLPDFHPANSVKAMRGCIYAQERDLLIPFATAVFEAYWEANSDIGQEAVLRPIAGALGLDEGDFIKAINSDEYRKKLRNNTDELVARGGFGSPTIFVNNKDMFFGNDRLVLVEWKIRTAMGLDSAAGSI